MKRVSACYMSVEDQEVSSILDANPLVKAHMALLLNGYRELCLMSFEAIRQGERDTADMWKSLGKKDTRSLNFGIPLCETIEDWVTLRQELDEAWEKKFHAEE